MPDLFCNLCKAPITLVDRHCPNCGTIAILLSRYWVKKKAKLGQGGFGMVYEATDLRLSLRCAVKEVSYQPGDEERIRSEVETLATLSNSGLVFVPKIYDYDDQDPLCYYIIMEYISGQTLDELFRPRQPWTPERVEEFLKLFLANLAHVHAAGVVHRDIKPQNIKYTTDGRYVLLDFGISKRATDSSSIRAYTQRYAPMEQRMGTGATDQRSDLFSLGVTAYELLTGSSPPDLDDRRKGKPILPPSSSVPSISRALDQLVMQMLELELEDRPRDARASLAILTGMITPPDAWESAKEEGESPAMFGSGSETTNSSHSTQRSTYKAALNRQGKGRIATMTASPDGRLLVVATPLGMYLYDAQTLEQQQFIESRLPIAPPAFVQQGRALAVVLDQGGHILSVPDGHLQRSLSNLPPQLKRIAFTPDGQVFATASDEGVLLWQTSGTQPATRLGNVSGASARLVFAPNGQTLAVASGNITQLWSVAEGRLLQTLEDLPSNVTSLAFLVDSQVIAISTGKIVQLWRVADGRLLRALDGHAERITSIACSPDSQTLAVATGAKIQLWRLSDGARLALLAGHPSTIISVAFVGDGQLIASASGESVRLWNVGNGSLARTLPGHMDRLHSVAFDPSGSLLASMGGIVQLWDVSAETLTLRRAFEGHTDQQNSVVFSPDGTMLAAASSKNITLWQVSDGTLISTIDATPAQANSIAFMPDGLTLTSISEQIETWRIQDGERISTYAENMDAVFDVALASDGQTVALLLDNLVQVRRVSDGQLIHELDAALLKASSSGLQTNSLALTPDGTTLAIISSSRLQIWDLRSFSMRAELPFGAQRAVWSWDGRAIALMQNTMISMYLDDGQALRIEQTFDGHADFVSDVAFAPHERAIASVALDGTIRIWHY